MTVSRPNGLEARWFGYRSRVKGCEVRSEVMGTQKIHRSDGSQVRMI